MKKTRDGSDGSKDGGHSSRENIEEKPEDIKFVRDDSIRTIFVGDPSIGRSNRDLGKYVKEARYKPLTYVNSLEVRPPKLFKGESADITFTE